MWKWQLERFSFLRLLQKFFALRLCCPPSTINRRFFFAINLGISLRFGQGRETIDRFTFPHTPSRLTAIVAAQAEVELKPLSCKKNLFTPIFFLCRPCPFFSFSRHGDPGRLSFPPFIPVSPIIGVIPSHCSAVSLVEAILHRRPREVLSSSHRSDHRELFCRTSATTSMARMAVPMSIVWVPPVKRTGEHSWVAAINEASSTEKRVVK